MTNVQLTLKRLLDLIVVIVFGPLILIIALLTALLIRLTDGPPAIFRQERAGHHGKPFTLYKFRTMRQDVDPFGPSPKTGHDNRLTTTGRFLRATSLDELPQFYNVLKGNMSLVGPRPLYMEQAREWNERQQKRLRVKPGLTGLAQISGRGSLTVEDKLELDVQYVERQTLARDLRILLATVVKVLRPKDIYEKRYSKNHQTRPKTPDKP